MTYLENLSSKIFTIKNSTDFEAIAIELFAWHYDNNKTYNSFCKTLNISPENTSNIFQIPCLPVNLFRYNKIVPTGYEHQIIFETSGTTKEETGKHYIVNQEIYINSFMNGFSHFYGDISEYAILALLPGYLERPNSSLVYMVSEWIKRSNNQHSGFYLYEHENLFNTLTLLKEKKQKTILIGVSYALLDFAENFQINFPELIVMETGGMKGKRKEMLRKEVHSILKKSFGVAAIHSEYGMTELLSQAYSKSDGIFFCPPWMKVYMRDLNDPLSQPENKNTGAINIIDLANIYSCPFIATEDVGVLFSNFSFEILGRMDYSAIRGCNTMIE